jgi:hypothetical protein
MNRLPFRSTGPESDLGPSSRNLKLDAAIVEADISSGFEEYLEIFDRFYARDIQASFESTKDRIVGKDAVRERLADFLVPLHIAAEVSGVSVVLRVTPLEATGPEETHSRWTVRLIFLSGTTCSLTWNTSRRWRNGQVISEHFYEYRQTDEPLPFADLQPQIDHLLPWRLN